MVFIKVEIIICKAETVINNHRIQTQDSKALFDYTEEIPKYSVFLHDYFANRRLNKKH